MLVYSCPQLFNEICYFFSMASLKPIKKTRFKFLGWDGTYELRVDKLDSAEIYSGA